MRFDLSRFVGVVSLGVGLCVAPAQQPQPKPFTPRIADGFSTDWDHLTMEQHVLAPNLTFLHASGGNTVVLAGPDGTLLVDPAFAQVAPLLKKTLTDMHAYPVKYVVGTHYHGDHSGGNGALHADGATIVAHENYLARMMQPQFSGMTGKTAPPAPTANWPSITYSKSMMFHMDGEDVELDFYEPSHTDGDTIVYFRKSNVVHLGDVFVNNLFPYIDLRGKGSVNGYFPVLDAVLARIDDHTVVVPGHGALATKAQLAAYRNMIRTVTDRVQASIGQGKTLAQIQAAQPTAEFDAQYSTDRVDGPKFVAMVYQSLSGKTQ